jgi:phosphate/phosphite/phosphonate ABC transporter binding protein
VPVVDDASARVRLVDLCVRLGEALEIEVRPHRSPSPEALVSAFRAGRVDVAWMSPMLFASMPSLADAVPLVRAVRAGRADYHSVLFTAAGSSIRTAYDLAGARVAWVSRSSAAGYVFPRLALADRGIDPRLLFGEELFLGSHTAVAGAVASGKADVGASFAVFDGGDPRREVLQAGFDEGSRIVLAAGPIPSDVVVASPRVAASMATRTRAAFMALARQPGAPDLLSALFGADAFERFEPSALEPVRDAAARLAAHDSAAVALR